MSFFLSFKAKTSGTLKLGEISHISSSHHLGGLSSADNSYSMDSFTNLSMTDTAVTTNPAPVASTDKAHIQQQQQQQHNRDPIVSKGRHHQLSSPRHSPKHHIANSTTIVAICPLTRQPIKDPAICIVDGFSYEKQAIEDYVMKHGESPITHAKVCIHDIHSAKRIQEEMFLTNQVEEEAKALTRLLMGGEDSNNNNIMAASGKTVENGEAYMKSTTAGRELANVPTRLLNLRKAAVKALQTFNHDQGISQQQQQQQAAAAAKARGSNKEGEGDKSHLNTISEKDENNENNIYNNESQEDETSLPKSAMSKKEVLTPVVGVQLAAALNDLELELLNAQRERKKQMAQVSLRIMESFIYACSYFWF
jgi:hypothetical protein